MLALPLAGPPDASLRVLCLGAHSDDIEIGCGGTLLTLLAQRPQCAVHWVVFSADATREQEARHSASLFLRSAARCEVIVQQFRDGFFPYVGADIKVYFEELKSVVSPDLIFTHRGDDRHQDHRLIAELTWNTFRDHAILEYEIPKYDGDLGSPNCFVALDEATARRKTDHLLCAFASQRAKRWFDRETFEGLMRLRGMECGAPERFAEGFYSRKLVLKP